MTKNKNSTRYYSSIQEEYVAKLLNGNVNSNSGACKFKKGDVVVEEASLLIECKTTTANKESFSIKKEWFEKNKNESFSMRMQNNCICFNFGIDSSNYFVIDEKLMRFLVEKLREENN